VIREAGPSDVPELLAMIHELATFEHLDDQVVCTEDDLAAALFAPGAVIFDTVAVDHDASGAEVIAGHALWYRNFSTFVGRTGIWLEDLYIRPGHRRRGHAGALLRDLRARTDGRVEWEVLNWNAEAIALYDGLGAEPISGWTKYRWLTKRTTGE